MTVEQGRQALIQRDLKQAEQLFSAALKHNATDLDALLGLGRAKLLMSKLREAESVASQAIALQQNFESELLMGEVLAAHGRRAEATNIFKLALTRAPSHARLKTLIAEQRLRQGYWDEGINYLVDAIAQDQDGSAFTHFQHIVKDMLLAVQENKIRPTDVLKLVDRLAQSTPKSNPQLDPFLIQTRQALSTGKPMPRAAKNESEAQLASMVKKPGTQTLMHKNEFMDSMRHEIQLNSSLQDAVSPLSSPQWPSLNDEHIDNIPPLKDEHPTISEMMNSLHERSFHVTDGSIFAQIFLDRFLRGLLDSVPSELAGTIDFSTTSLSQLELNFRDDFLEELKEIHTDDLREHIDACEPYSMAIGAFIGSCIEREAQGVWSYNKAPEQSFLCIDTLEINPFETAKKWMLAKDKNEVSLHEPLERALRQRAQYTEISFGHIDDTADLNAEALISKLADKWSFYRMKLVRVPGSEIAGDMTLMWQNQSCVIFQLAECWMPKMSQTVKTHARLEQGGFAIAYIKHTGEFLILGERKDLARALSSIMEDLNMKNAHTLMHIISEYHIPHKAILVEHADQSIQLSSTLGKNIEPPMYQDMQSHQILNISVVRNQVEHWQIDYEKEKLTPWSITIH